MDPDTGPRFRVALSYAGEQRPFVSQVAERLAAVLGRDRVFYDEFYAAGMARPDSDLYLQQAYRDSGLFVAFLSADYVRKDWTGLEWRVVRDLIKKKSSDQVMLFKFDDTPVPGLLEIDHAYDVRGHTPAQIANLILERLGLPVGTKGTARENPRPKTRRLWLGLPVLVGLLSYAGWVLLIRQSHVLLLVPGEGLFERLPRVNDREPHADDLVCDLSIGLRGSESPLHDLRRQPIYLGASDRLDATARAGKVSRWGREAEAWSRRPLAMGEKDILTALSKEQPVLVETQHLKEGDEIETKLLCRKGNQPEPEVRGSFPIDGRSDPQLVFLVKPAEKDSHH
jgi:TIR domain